MRRARAILALAGLLVVTAAGGRAQTIPSDIRAAINRGNAAFIKAYKDGDAAALARIFDEDGSRLLRGGVVLHGHSAIQADAAKDFKQDGPMVVTIETVDIWVLGDTAYEAGNFTVTIKPSGEEPRTGNGRYVVSWKKQKDGSWKMWTEISSPNDDSVTPDTTPDQPPLQASGARS